MLMKIINLTLLLQINLVCSFDIYWNIPSFMCKKYANFSNLTSQYGIIQNDDDLFRGNKIAILYDPGKFPAILTDDVTKKNYYRNGGVPQQGNLEEHLNQYITDVDQQIPDTNYDGKIIIDFESWRPVFRQNFGSLLIYKKLAIEIERDRHPFWSQAMIEKEAERRWEEAGRVFMEETIKLSKKIRPKAKWGYYAFPYCFNNKGEDFCDPQVKKENDQTKWIYNNSDIILPSVYLSENLPESKRPKLVKGRVKEAMRMSSQVKYKPVYVYIRYVYTDSRNFLTEDDLLQVFTLSKCLKAEGIILWGSSSDLKTSQQCLDFENYLKNVLGPISNSYREYRVFPG